MNIQIKMMINFGKAKHCIGVKRNFQDTHILIIKMPGGNTNNNLKINDKNKFFR